MEEGSPRKTKRTAEHQISKDDDSEGDGAAGGEVAGTFQRAPAEVLRSRRILKVNRGRSSSPEEPAAAVPCATSGPGFPSVPPTANPFQKLVLTPSAASQSQGGSSGENPAAAAAAASSATNGSVDPAVADADQAPPASTSVEPTGVPTGAAVAAAPAVAVVEAESTDSPANPTSADDALEKEDTSVPAASEQQPPSAAAAALAGSATATAAVAAVAAGGEEPAIQQQLASDGNGGTDPSPAPSTEASAEAGGGTKMSPVTAEENGKTREGNGVHDGDGDAGTKKTAVAKLGGGGVGTGGVVSFAALGGVGVGGGGSGGGGPFQSLLKGAGTPSAPLSFAGFGSSAPSLPLPSEMQATFGAPSSASGAAAAGSSPAKGPVLSFGSPTGVAAFTSFTSFAAAPSGSAWGSMSKNALAAAGGDDGKGKNGQGGGSSGAAAAAGVATSAPLELMDPSEVVNGEEMEECTHRARAKIFRLMSKEWVEMGVGNLKVLRRLDVSTASAKGEENGPNARLVMRREAGHQVILNVSLQGQTICSNQGEKALLLACFTAEGPATYLIKVKTPEDASNLKAAIDAVLPSEAA